LFKIFSVFLKPFKMEQFSDLLNQVFLDIFNDISFVSAIFLAVFKGFFNSLNYFCLSLERKIHDFCRRFESSHGRVWFITFSAIKNYSTKCAWILTIWMKLKRKYFSEKFNFRQLFRFRWNFFARIIQNDFRFLPGNVAWHDTLNTIQILTIHILLRLSYEQT
jgi:hypothetical protein